MSTIEQADLVRRVLRYLKVAEGAEAISSEDDAVVDDAITDLHAELQEKSLAYWELSAIPQAVLPGLIRMVGADVAHAFMDTQEALAYESRRDAGERLIRAVIARPGDHAPIPHHYF